MFVVHPISGNQVQIYIDHVTKHAFPSRQNENKNAELNLRNANEGCFVSSAIFVTEFIESKA